MTARISGGVLVPLCSPCDGEDRFRVLPYQEGLRACLDAPIDGFYVCGGTGEGSRMGTGERMQACEAAGELARPAGQKVLVQVGAGDSETSLLLARRAAEAGADGVSTVPLPGLSWEEQLAYYAELPQASGLETVLYYTPGCTATLEQMKQALALPGITGIKSSTNDFFFTMQLLDAKPEGVVLFNGKDEYLAPAVLQGAEGGIGMWAAAFPGAYASIYRHAAAGELTEAFALQTVLNRLCCVVFRYGLLPAFSAILEHQGRWSRVFRQSAGEFDEAFRTAFLRDALPLIQRLEAARKGDAQ